MGGRPDLFCLCVCLVQQGSNVVFGEALLFQVFDLLLSRRALDGLVLEELARNLAQVDRVCRILLLRGGLGLCIVGVAHCRGLNFFQIVFRDRDQIIAKLVRAVQRGGTEGCCWMKLAGIADDARSGEPHASAGHR